MGFIEKFKDALVFHEEDDLDDEELFLKEMAKLEAKEKEKERKKIEKQRAAERMAERNEHIANSHSESNFSFEKFSPKNLLNKFNRENTEERESRSNYSSDRRSGSSNKNSSNRSSSSRSSSVSSGRQYVKPSASRSTSSRTSASNYNNNRTAGTYAPKRSNNIYKFKGRDASNIAIYNVATFDDAQDVCDRLMEGNPIIVRFGDPQTTEAQRVMDFIAGCIYVIDGNLHTISDRVFLFSPNGVDVSGDYLNMMQNNSFGVPTFNKMF